MKQLPQTTVNEAFGVKEFVEKNLSDPFLESNLKQEFNKNLTEIQEIFKSIFGKTITQFILDNRMSLALDLLKKGNSCSNVAKAIGKTSNIFTTWFKNNYGYNPSEVISQKTIGASIPPPEINIEQVKNYIQDNIHQPITTKNVAKIIGIDRFELEEVFVNETGAKLHDYIQEKRAECIENYLSEKMDIEKICSIMNFPSVQNLESFVRRNLGSSLKGIRKERLLNRRLDKEPSHDWETIINGIIKYIRLNLNTTNLIKDIAREFQFPEYLIDKAFLDIHAISVCDYILKERMMYAKELIDEGLFLNRVAESVGFNSESEFIIAFRSYFGDSADEIIKGLASTITQDQFASINNYIENNITTEIKLSSLASSVGLTKDEVMKTISQYTHLTFIGYISKIRIDFSKLLLVAEYDMEEVARKVGYSNAFCFSQAFKRSTGMSVKTYLAQLDLD